ncbi:hypothetical protein ACFQ5J_07050 [Lacticaseibacillus baoqingensis]|uniref:Uncharacterized protein n=1 Tax=Lacticaseibacillus baoqingensis TaxID=2486013 RepID=A0ABW4E6X1_9LACO|nr:hypothetical protein [Lacticaseibacillus baoqingensis]
MRFSLFDWLLLGFALIGCIALAVIQAYLPAVVLAALMVVALLIHRSSGRPSQLL